MTVKITKIHGQRGSACNNDAYSVVLRGQNPSLLAIVAADELAGKSRAQIRAVFADAVAHHEPEIIRAVINASNTVDEIPHGSQEPRRSGQFVLPRFAVAEPA